MVLIKPSKDKTCAEVLVKIGRQVKPEDTETEIINIHKTRVGCILVKLGKNTKDLTAFTDALKEVVGEMGTAECRAPKTMLEILDLDAITTIVEVEKAKAKINQ